MELEQVVVVAQNQHKNHCAPQIETRRLPTKPAGVMHPKKVRQEWKAKDPTTIVSDDHVEIREAQRWQFIRLSHDSIPVIVLSETSIHGLKYIAQKDRHWFERLFWLISFVLGVICSGYLIHGMWDRYSKTPVIVTFDANEQSTKLIPFPAVTICSDNLVSRRKVEELIRTVNNYRSSGLARNEARKKLSIINAACRSQVDNFIEVSLPHSETGQVVFQPVGVDNDDLFNFLMKDTVPCDKMIRECRFGEFSGDCSELFESIISHDQKCCTFNILPPQLLFKNITKAATAHWASSELVNWARGIQEKHYDVLEPNVPYRPRMQIVTGRIHGLTIVIAPDKDDLVCATPGSPGLKFMLHSALEMPRMNDLSSVADTGKQIVVEIIADITKADEDIRNLPPAQRKCVSPNERELHTFTHYTRENCIVECTDAYLMKQCGCKPFLSSLYDGGLGGRSCNPTTDESCILKEHAKLQYYIDTVCAGCVPLCEEIKYSHQTTMTNLKLNSRVWDIRNYLGMLPTWANNNETVMHVYFSSDRTIPKLRKALYGLEDLIANTGGILGLCLGFSVLSGIELVYLVTLRPMFHQCRKWSSTFSVVSLTSKLKGVFKSKTMVASFGGNGKPVEEGVVNDGWM